MRYNDLQQKAIEAVDERVLVVAPAGSGKALSDNTGVLTPNGYRPIGELQIGDVVYDGQGKQTKITAIYPQGKKQIYKVTFSNGQVIECCSEHLWLFQTKSQRDEKTNKWTLKTTKQIVDTIPLYKSSGQHNAKNIYMPTYDYIEFKEQPLPLKPYLLGALIGDGGLSGETHIFTNTDREVVDRVSAELLEIDNYLSYKDRYDYVITSKKPEIYSNYKAIMRELELDGIHSNTKFIPKQYLFNSVDNRIELLKGLMDTDGSCKGSSYEYITVSKQLAEDIKFLCISLGYTVSINIKKTSYINSEGIRVKCKNAYRLHIKTNDVNPIITFCGRKTELYKRGQTTARVAMTSIEKTEEYTNMTCITVDSPTHTYVIEGGIVTHNTSSLVGAIEHYHKENPTDRMVAITFTRKAAAELGNRTFGVPVEASTIHSWSLKELNRLGGQYKFKVSLLQDNQIQEILKTLSRKCGYYSLNQFMLFSYVMGNYNIDVARSTKSKFEKVMKEYISYKRSNKLYDFTDLPLYLHDMLMLHGERITNIDALFVDEFQDVDDTQAKIFELVDAKKYFYIGDPAQCIYGFRGCGSHNLSNLNGFTTYRLNINYRSYQKIVDYANTIRNHNGLISDITKCKPCDVVCHRDDNDGEVIVITPEEECIDVVTQQHKDLVSTLTTFLLQRPYILCRSNKQVKQFESLGYKNVSTIHQAKGLEYANVIVTDMALNTEEEVNIAYVACTRAQNGLLICDADSLYMYMNEILMEYRDEICGGKLF